MPTSTQISTTTTEPFSSTDDDETKVLSSTKPASTTNKTTTTVPTITTALEQGYGSKHIVLKNLIWNYDNLKLCIVNDKKSLLELYIWLYMSILYMCVI